MGFSGSAPENKSQAAIPASAAEPVAEVAVSNNEVIAVIAAAIATCTDCEQLAYIGKMDSSSGWTNSARVEATTVRNQMF